MRKIEGVWTRVRAVCNNRKLHVCQGLDRGGLEALAGCFYFVIDEFNFYNQQFFLVINVVLFKIIVRVFVSFCFRRD